MPSIFIDCYEVELRPRIAISRGEKTRYYWATKASLARVSRHVTYNRFIVRPWLSAVGWNAYKEADNA